MNESDDHSPTRRKILIGAGCFAGALPLLAVRRVQATPATMATAIRQVVGEANVTPGKVKLDLPPLVENGNSVQYTVTVDNPMTASNYVKAIYVFNEKNPQPNVISVHLGPRAGRASFTSRTRLADLERVVAIAELSDGTFWSDTVEVIVTIAACVEDGMP